MLIFSGDEAAPLFLFVFPEDAVKVAVQANVVLLEVAVQLVCPEHFGDFVQLVVVVISLEKWFLPK